MSLSGINFEDEMTALVDVLQVKMSIYKKGDNVKLLGNRTFKLPLSSVAGSDADLVLPAKVEGSYTSDGRAAVLVHIKGHLFVYATCIKAREGSSFSEGVLDFRILDAGKGGVRMMRIAAHDVHIDIARKLLEPYTKAVFTKKVKDTKWLVMQGKSAHGKADTVVEVDTPKPKPDAPSAVEGNGRNVQKRRIQRGIAT